MKNQNQVIEKWNSLDSNQKAKFGDAQFASPQRSLNPWKKSFEELSKEKQDRVIAQSEWIMTF